MDNPSMFPGLAKKNDNPLAEPVRNVVDGWKLSNGNLCLFVRCEDGTTREITLTLKKSSPAQTPIEVKMPPRGCA